MEGIERLILLRFFPYCKPPYWSPERTPWVWGRSPHRDSAYLPRFYILDNYIYVFIYQYITTVKYLTNLTTYIYK